MGLWDDIKSVAGDAADVVLDAAGDAVDTLVDAAEDGVEALADFVDDAGEWVAETAEDIGEFAADVAEAAWDWVSDTAGSIWDWVKKTAGDIWEWTTTTASDVWDWVKETASSAWDWIENTAGSVWDFIVNVSEAAVEFVKEKVVPFLLDVLWTLTHLDDLLIGLGKGILCLIFGEDEREYSVIEGMFNMEDDVLNKRRIAFASKTQKYVIFSDHHYFVHGDPLDKFRKIGNHELYKEVLAIYGMAGFTLIENGDVEDLWMRETSLSGTFMEIATDVLGWPFGDMIEDDYEDTRVRSQAAKIFENNSDVYEVVRALFHDKNKFIKLAGNHDDYWRNSEYSPLLEFVYPGIRVYDYAFIGDYPTALESHNGTHPEAIVAHGHQLDAWNNSVCREAGQAITGSASGIPSIATTVTKRRDWEKKLNGYGFENVLSESLASIDEVEFYESIEEDFDDQPYVPDFVFGHTHHALKDPQIPGWMYRDEVNFKEYTNDGTAGRWEEFIWCAVHMNGKTTLHGWVLGDDGKPHLYTFTGGYADLLRAG